MDIASCAGVWNLVGSLEIRDEIELIDEEPDPRGAEDWLNGDAAVHVGDANAMSGLELTIAVDGAFSERKTGEPEVYWFGADGVLQDFAEPFDGEVVFNGHQLFLRPVDIPRWAAPVDSRYGDAVLRLDDGDTQISDRIQVVGEKLVRTVNVVTDGLYLDRVMIVYERQ